MTLPGYEHFHDYYGDLHSHCSISYGHGPIEDAYHNARLQLDFASVTPHGYWPDMPVGDEALADVVAYHEEGFRRAAQLWPHAQEVTNAVNDDGKFVSFLSFEWHSLYSGDHNVYFRDGQGEIIPAPTLEAMRVRLRELAKEGIASFLLPHHIGYLRGYRGIRWEEFSPEFSPVVEIFSMHGCSESDEAPFPYLHTMGPRDGRSTAQYGLAQGNVFGLIGSTDQHSAYPGSYGHGRLGVWATELTRAGIWAAIADRRTYALSGDNISLAFALNGQPMGAVLPATEERALEVEVTGGAAIDYVEILHNNRIIHRWSPPDVDSNDITEPVKVALEVGWGEQSGDVDWRVELEVAGGRLRSVEPRFRGRDIVAPQAELENAFVFSDWRQRDDHRVEFTTRSWQNPTIVTPAMQGICLEIDGDASTRIEGRINDQPVSLSLRELREGSRAGYLGGVLSPGYRFHRAVPHNRFAGRTSFVHRATGNERDWYYARVRQTNGEWAWGSPIWVGNGL